MWFSLRRDFKAPRHGANASALLLRVESDAERKKDESSRLLKDSPHKNNYLEVLVASCK